jgi:hypothetical protein
MRLFPSLAVLALLQSSTAWADPLSGPGRTTIFTLPWGTIYYVPKDVGELSILEDDARATFTAHTPRGEVGFDGRTLRSGADSLVTIEQDSVDRLQIRFLGELCSFIGVQGPLRRFVVTLGARTVSMEEGPATAKVRERVEVSGTDLRGELLVQSESVGRAERVVRGPAGITVLGAQGFTTTASGPPLSAHTFLLRGVILEHDGFGVFIDMKRLNPFWSMFPELDWDSVLVIRRP